MKAKELYEMTNAELSGQLNELKQHYFNLRFQHATGQLEDTSTISLVKKDIARCMTVIRQRELGQSQEPASKPAKAKAAKSTKAKTATEEA